MKGFNETVNWKILQAGVLLLVGLLLIFSTLLWTHALSFILFCVAGVLVTSLGILMYIFWLLS